MSRILSQKREQERPKLFWSLVEMSNNSTPINDISNTDKVVNREIVELHKLHGLT